MDIKKIVAVAATAFIMVLSIIAYSPDRHLNAEETRTEIMTETPSEILSRMAEEAVAQPEPSLSDRLKEFASKFLGRRYVYGSTGPKSFDCSGFTSYVFRNAGIELPRTSRMQYGVGEKVDRKDIKAGDLMFFSSPRSGKGRVGHVAMVVDVNENDGSLTFIHASNSKGVNLQKFPDGGYYSRNFIGAKRVVTEPVA